jgi:hypothetical protein
VGPLRRGLRDEQHDRAGPAPAEERQHAEPRQVAPQAEEGRLVAVARDDVENQAPVLGIDPDDVECRLHRGLDRGGAVLGKHDHGV